MRTIPTTPNQTLRQSMLRGDHDVLELLLASMFVLAHDGTLELERDGSLPRGEALPLGIARHEDGTWCLGAYSDLEAVDAPDAPTAGPETPLVPMAGDDLVMLAAANHVGIHVNPGSEEHLVLSAAKLRDLAGHIRRDRSAAQLRTVDDRTLVTMRAVDLKLDDERQALLERELTARGASIAFVAEYALHDKASDPNRFSQVLVVGDEEGMADFQLREDTRRVVSFLTGVATDSVAYASMPHVRHITQPVLLRVEELPEPLVGTV